MQNAFHYIMKDQISIWLIVGFRPLYSPLPHKHLLVYWTSKYTTIAASQTTTKIAQLAISPEVLSEINIQCIFYANLNAICTPCAPKSKHCASYQMAIPQTSIHPPWASRRRASLKSIILIIKLNPAEGTSTRDLYMRNLNILRACCVFAFSSITQNLLICARVGAGRSHHKMI